METNVHNIINSFEAKTMRVVHYVSMFFSALLSPLLMPTYGMIVSLWLSNLLVLTLPTKLTVILTVFLITAVLPAILFLLLKYLKIIETTSLNGRKERLFPYLIIIVCYVASAIYLFSINAPEWLWMFMFGGGCAAVVSMLVNFKWKISAHMASSGMMVGGLLSYSFIFRFNPVGWLCFFILLAGMLGSARIIVRQHTLGEVCGGFFVGLFCGVIGILFI